MKQRQVGGWLGAVVALALAAPSLRGDEPPLHCPFSPGLLAEEGTTTEELRRPRQAAKSERRGIRYSHTSVLSQEEVKTPLRSPHKEQRTGDSGMTVWEIIQLVVICISAVVVTWYAYRKVG